MELPQTYRAYQYASYGLPDQELKLCPNVKFSPLSPTQVRVKVISAALNPVDYLLMNENAGTALIGTAPTKEKPFNMGFDGAGIVVEIGNDVKRLAVGDEVYAMTPFNGIGTLAEFVAIDEQYVARKPINASFDQAAGVPLAALTSYQALVEHTKLQSNETVLILGGSSGVGTFAVQFARAIGAHVIATTSAKNAELVKSLGADQVVDYKSYKWVDVLPEHSVDVIYDCGMESAAWNHDAQLVLKKSTGRFVTLWPVEEPVVSPKFGAKLVGHMQVHPSGENLAAITALIERGEVTTVVDSVYAFEKVLEAIGKQQGGHASGKLVIQVQASK